MGDHNELPDLIRRVKEGDSIAFELLLSAYRSAALSWAQAVVRDAFLAEDVVQEAFLKVKDNIHDLKDEEKFGAWFRVMVRRIAMNSIRRAANRSEYVTEDIPETGWEASSGGEAFSPEAWQEREEGEDLIRSSMRPLSEQAREVLSANAFEDATTEELAARFGMKPSNIYNLLSRARVKANEERFRKEIERYLEVRKKSGHRAARTLPLPVFSRPYAFLSVMIGEALRTVGEEHISHTELMGISGDAFRLNVAKSCHSHGISTFDWSYTAYRILERLGIRGTCFGRPQRKTLTPEQQVHILSILHGSIDQGVPAIIWNMQSNEFGFIYGYDDSEQKILYLGHNGVERIVRYDQLGRKADQPPLFVLGIRGKVAPSQTVDATLRAIIDHARGKEPPLAGYAFGLDGYRLWLEAVEDGSLDLQGHAYQVAILAEARQHAAKYLLELSNNSNNVWRKQRLAEAAACYTQVSESFTRLYPSFPFGYGGSHAGRMSKIREELRFAWEAEKEGIHIISAIVE
ncbi:RNA polymerase sigma factor [Paenibacillus sp. P36]|uniref:RNA polymerase sigma factor n=1 Tax=Paenibacillus sp. P36 TaxID=3342538 RepID=UPI0038B41039